MILGFILYCIEFRLIFNLIKEYHLKDKYGKIYQNPVNVSIKGWILIGEILKDWKVSGVNEVIRLRGIVN